MTAEIYPFPELKPNMPSLPAMVCVLKSNYAKLDEIDKGWLMRAELIVNYGEEAKPEVILDMSRLCYSICKRYNLKCDEFEVLPVA